MKEFFIFAMYAVPNFESILILLYKYCPRILHAGLIIIFGFIVAKVSSVITRRRLAKTDPTAKNFLSNIIFTVLFIPAIIMGLSRVGFHTSSMVAIVGSLGIAAGIAFQQSLSNISSGLMIVLFRPFKIDDSIDVDQVAGTVKEIGLFSTRILMADYKEVLIPNSKVMSNKIINFSNQKMRRSDIDITIDFEEDVVKVKVILRDILMKDQRILEYPISMIVVTGIKDNGVSLGVRPWVLSEHYWDVTFDIHEQIKNEFKSRNIKFASQRIMLIK